MSTGWRSLLDRDKKNVARITIFIDKLEAERKTNPAIINDPAHWNQAEQGIRALTWIYSRPMYSDEDAHEEVEAFHKQLFDVKLKALRNLHAGSNAEVELKELQRSTRFDWDLVGIPEETDIWMKQERDIEEQRHLDERRRGKGRR